MKRKCFYIVMGLSVILLTAGILYFLKLQASNISPKIYVANEGDGTISVINEETLEVVKTIPLSGLPHNVNVDPLGRYVYATNHEGESEEEHEEGKEKAKEKDELDENEHKMHSPYLRIIDAKSHKLIESIPMMEMAAHVVPSRDGKVVYVSIEGFSNLVVIDPIQFRLLKNLNVGHGPHGFVLSNSGSTLYVPNMRSNDISVLDLITGNEERMKISFDGYDCEAPTAIGITNDDLYSFVTCSKSFEIYKIDNLNKKVIGIIELTKGEPPGPVQIPVHPSNKWLYVPDMRNGVVHKIDVVNFKVVNDIPSGAGAHGIAYGSEGKTAYVTNTWENTVSVINLETDAVVKKINVGLKPNGIAVSNGKNQGW